MICHWDKYGYLIQKGGKNILSHWQFFFFLVLSMNIVEFLCFLSPLVRCAVAPRLLQSLSKEQHIKGPFPSKQWRLRNTNACPLPFCQSLIWLICFVSCVSPLFRKGSASEVVIKHHTLIHVQMHPGLFETEAMEDRTRRKLINRGKGKQGGRRGESVRPSSGLHVSCSSCSGLCRPVNREDPSVPRWILNRTRIESACAERTFARQFSPFVLKGTQSTN